MIRVARVDLGLTYRGGLYIISEQNKVKIMKSHSPWYASSQPLVAVVEVWVWSSVELRHRHSHSALHLVLQQPSTDSSTDITYALKTDSHLEVRCLSEQRLRGRSAVWTQWIPLRRVVDGGMAPDRISP